MENELISLDLNVTRLGGADRYDTAKRVLEHFQPSPSRITLTTGTDFPDALAGALLAARNNAPLMLFDEQTMTPEVKAYVKALLLNKQPYILGGENVLSMD